MKAKWRGINTTQIPKNEDKAITIVNRLGQKSISLPRIDDKKRWSGYPGIAGTARKIAKLIPFTDTYVEPFAGTVKVYQEYLKRGDWNYNKVILNDMSPFVTTWLKREFPEAKVTSIDFIKCIKKHDTRTTFFLFDPPWFKSYYDQGFSSFNRESVRQYDEELIEICKSIKGKFIITTRKENKVMLNSGFYHKLIKSEYVVSGKYPKVLLTTNIKVRKNGKKNLPNL